MPSIDVSLHPAGAAGGNVGPRCLSPAFRLPPGTPDHLPRPVGGSAVEVAVAWVVICTGVFPVVAGVRGMRTRRSIAA